MSTETDVLIEMTEKTLATIVGLRANQSSQDLIGVLVGIADIGAREIATRKMDVPQYTHLHDALVAGGVASWIETNS